MAVLFIFLVNRYKDDYAAEITGFLYGAPLLLPYFAIVVYMSVGSEAMPSFAAHTLAGLIFTIPLLIALWCTRTRYGLMLASSVVYLIVIFIF